MKAEVIAELQKGSSTIKIYHELNNTNFLYYAIVNGLLSKVTGKTTLTTQKVSRFPELLRLLKLHFIEWYEFELTSCTKFKKAIKASLIGEKTHYNSQLRILDLFHQLQKERTINVQQAMIDYGVHKETIKSDIYRMREVLENDFINIEANDQDGTYKISASDKFTAGDAFVLLLMMYHTQSLSLKEVKLLQKKIISQFSIAEQKRLRTFFQSYEHYYREFISVNLLPDIESIFRAIQQHKLITFTYKKYDGTSKVRKVKPLTIILYDKAYYLVACEIGSDNAYPRNFGLDRVFHLHVLEDTIIPDKSEVPFQPGQYANQSFNMFSGKIETVKLKVRPVIKPYFIRRFPLSRIIKEDSQAVIAEVEVAGTEGIMFWILSQKTDVEVLHPASLREKMKQSLTDMLKLYTE